MRTTRRLQGFAIIVAASLGAVGCGGGDHRGVSFDLAPDGRSIVFAAADKDLYIFELATSRVARLTQTPEPELSPTFSPDGRGVAYASDPGWREGYHLFLRTIDGGGVKQLTNDPGVCDHSPRFSHDGSQIAFARAALSRPYSMGGWTWDDWDVYVMVSDGTHVRPVTQMDYYGIGEVGFSSDDHRVIYDADADRHANDLTGTIWEVSATGGVPSRRLADGLPKLKDGNARYASDPSPSNSGKGLTFIASGARQYNYDVWTMGMDASGARPLGLTEITRYPQSPRYTPDGKTILFLAGRWVGGRRLFFSLWAVDADGKNPRQIAGESLFTDPLSYRPQ